jgi:hypothetical protein
VANVNESYILEIIGEVDRLALIKQRKLTTAEFDQACKLDVNAGYRDEVAEAKRRYFQ